MRVDGADFMSDDDNKLLSAFTLLLARLLTYLVHEWEHRGDNAFSI
jgi:hypothetical protein